VSPRQSANLNADVMSLVFSSLHVGTGVASHSRVHTKAAIGSPAVAMIYDRIRLML